MRTADGGGQSAFLLARPMDQIHVSDILQAVRGPRAASLAIADVARQVVQTLGEIDHQAAQVSEARSLRELVDGLGRGVDPREAAA